MNLRELELALAESRKEQKLSYHALRKHGLPRETVMRIEEGGNYTIKSLLKYIDQLVFIFLIKQDNDSSIAILNLKDLGDFLRERRRTLDISMETISSKTGVTLKAIDSLELGRGCKRSTLKAYSDVIPLDFELDSMLNWEE